MGNVGIRAFTTLVYIFMFAPIAVVVLLFALRMYPFVPTASLLSVVDALAASRSPLV